MHRYSFIAVLLVVLSPGKIFAQCVDTTTDAEIPSITCSGPSFNPIEDDRNNLRFIINEGATISLQNSGDIISLTGDNLEIINNGLVGQSELTSGSIDDAFLLPGNFFDFVNSSTGRIVGVANAITARGEALGGSFTNNGLISTTGTSLLLDTPGNFSFTNEVSGIVRSESNIIDAASGQDTILSINNFGLLQGEETIDADILLLVNQGNIIGTGTSNSIVFDSGNILNSGTISASSDALSFVSGRIENEGLISSQQDSAIFIFNPSNPQPNDNLDTTIINRGDIAGAEFAINVREPSARSGITETVQNVMHLGGLLSGQSGAVALSEGDDSFSIGFGADLIGDVLLEGGADTLVLLTQVNEIERSIFNGGEGDDIIVFDNNVDFNDIFSAQIAEGLFLITFNEDGASGSVRVTNFERVLLGNVTLSFNEFISATAIVPAPAALYCFICGLVFLLRQHGLLLFSINR